MKSNFSKIDENIADAPYRVNRKALGPGGSWQPVAGRKCHVASPSIGLAAVIMLFQRHNDSVAKLGTRLRD